MVLAIIPARAGSKRIKNKNIKNFLGKPLIAYTIEQALACDFIERVVVDTDSERIAGIARRYGAEVPWLRPKKLAGDKSQAIDYVLYDLSRFEREENYRPDYVVILQTTSPLREKKDIVDCWQMMQKIKADTVLTVCPTHPRLYNLDGKKKLILANRSVKKSTNIQAWPPGYILNGCFVYIIKASALLEEKTIITKNTRAVICDKWRSVDLDEPADWAIAEFLYKIEVKSGRGSNNSAIIKNMEKNKLKFLIVGLGSMGKRRIRNLLFNGIKPEQIIGYDIRPDRKQEAKKIYGIEIVDNFKTISSKDFDVMIISTPPDQHGDYIRMALRLKKHFFVEHPTNDDGYKEIFKDKNFHLAKVPSCTLMFYRPIKMIKDILEKGKIGKILAFQYQLGQYLPDWHPYEDYRQVYFSKKTTGACREMLPFELIWLNWLMGSKVERISGSVNKVSNLEMKADDIILANLKYKNGIVGNVIIDVISRKPCRTLRVLGSKGVLDWERFDSVIKVYNAKSRQTKNITVPKGHPIKGCINEEEMYQDEISAFLRSINGRGKYPHTFFDSLGLLQTLYVLEKNHRTGKMILL